MLTLNINGKYQTLDVPVDMPLLWGWNPGGNRAPVPVPHDIFVTQFKLWADAGGPCPAPVESVADRP
jgi:hypothetical protein